ncbi:zinc finger protein 135-like [Anopheles moucheti]|uniref:zinc finger protein 135-like n=1 Tax=Anopheles moucheti TaxID=186751 RepID=UPI0022F019D4|nr:zinc finger protein 135-like [Anopheles moucheti]
MIVRQFVTGSNAVEEIYIVQSDCSSFVNETTDNGSATCNDTHDTAEQGVASRIENTIIGNRKTEPTDTKPRQEYFTIDARASDIHPVSIVKLSNNRQHAASAQSQSGPDNHICQLCFVTFKTSVMLKQHLELNHHHMLPFKCKSCASSEIRSVLQLNNHFSQHDRNKMHKCSYCEARFDSAMRRSAHQRRFHQNTVRNGSSVGRYTCRYCGKRFVAKWNFGRHERNHEKMLTLSGEVDIFDFLYHCYLCRKQFTSKQTLYEHLHVHVDRLPYRCDRCVTSNVTIFSVRLLNKHVALHLEKKPVKCMYCAETFISIKECETHERHNHGGSSGDGHNLDKNDKENETSKGCERSINDNHTNEILRYECSFCNKSYSLLSTLRRHENIHTENRQFLCKICGKMFKKKSCLSQHERSHLDNIPYKCGDCGKGFKETIHLIVHRRIHTGEKPFQCDHCMKQFRLKSLLKEHTVKCAIKQIPPAQDARCEHCLRVFPSEHLLTKHVLELHSQYMFTDSKCSYCDKKLKSDKALLEHETQHGQPGVIECKECGRIFKQRSNLRRHQRLHTMNVIPYKCDMCGKSFSQQSTMTVHRRMHTGEKPYKCEICGKCFQYSSTKNRHKRLHYKKGSKLFVSFPNPSDAANGEINVSYRNI